MRTIFLLIHLPNSFLRNQSMKWKTFSIENGYFRKKSRILVELGTLEFLANVRIEHMFPIKPRFPFDFCSTQSLLVD